MRCRLYAADLVLPRWAVRRALDDGSRQYELHRGLVLPRGAFHPAGRTDAVVLAIRRR